MLGLDGIEVGLIVVFVCLFAGVLSGFPVAFAIGGAGLMAFTILAMLDTSGLLVHFAIDTVSADYQALIKAGVTRNEITSFRYPDLPLIEQPLFPDGWFRAFGRSLSFIVNRMNERVIAGQSIETLLAVLMFVMMGLVLERSHIAHDLLTTMARVFGPLPGGLAVAVVVVGTLLAASTGIVGATVVTMGILSLPTMLRAGYAPQLATGVIAASGTLGQIIPPSIVIILLGTLAGDLYSTSQESRAQAVGCSDALTYLGKAAVVSVGSLFQAALLPGILLAVLYAVYAFAYALFNPSKAPPIKVDPDADRTKPAKELGKKIAWVLIPPTLLLGSLTIGVLTGFIGSQTITTESAFLTKGTVLRTNVSDSCRTAMIELHGIEKWEQAVAARNQPASTATSRTDEIVVAPNYADLPPIGSGVATLIVLLGLILTTACAITTAILRPVWLGGSGLIAMAVADIAIIGPQSSPAFTALVLALPFSVALGGSAYAAALVARNELIRIIFPPLVLIVAVLGSILGGITNPTPAAALGAVGAMMLAAYRLLRNENRSGRIIVGSAFALVIMILLGANVDLRVDVGDPSFARWIIFGIAVICYHIVFAGLFYAVWILLRGNVLTPVVRETAKITSMVFTILIGSQILNLVLISFGGEHYIQNFLRYFDNELMVFLIVMLVLFVLGFVLDFLEIIYIVIPIVGPVIYGGSLDPKWVTIMIAINLQTSFLTPPFGFALFYLRGVAPRSVTTWQIYQGVVPFVIIQLVGLYILWLAPGFVTIIPDLF